MTTPENEIKTLTRHNRRAVKNKLMVLTNSVGGPRILHDDETVDLAAQETVDGAPPDFRMMTPKAAAKYLSKHERGDSHPLAEVMLDRDNIKRSKFLRFAHSKTGMPPPYHLDPWWRAVEDTARFNPDNLTEEDIARLEREGYEAKIEVIVTEGALELAEMDDIAKALSDMMPALVPHPATSLEQARHDRMMLDDIIPKMEQGKPVTPAQKNFLIDLIDRYQQGGMPLPLDIVTTFAGLPVQGDGELHKWPTLADDIVHSPISQSKAITQHTVKRLNNTLAHCEKMVLDATAVQRVAEATRSYPEQLAMNAEFARPPFERCWIELPNRVWAASHGIALGPDADDRIGFLFVGSQVYVASQSPGMAPAWSPIVYDLNTVPSQSKLEHEIERVGGTRVDLNEFYMSRALLELAGENVALSLRGQHGFHVLSGPSGKPPHWRAFSGDVPLIVALLLAINTPSNQVIQYRDMPKRWRTTHKGKKALHAHRIVTIDLDRAPGVRLINRERDEDRETRHVGWHNVRGHFVHDRRYREVRNKGICDHGHGGEWWTEFEPNRWECLNCGSKRTWRTYPNGRGDKSKPVEHHYHVKG